MLAIIMIIGTMKVFNLERPLGSVDIINGEWWGLLNLGNARPASSLRCQKHSDFPRECEVSPVVRISATPAQRTFYIA